MWRHPVHRRARLRAVAHVVRLQLAWKLFGKTVEVETAYGARLRCGPETHRDVAYFRGLHDWPAMQFLRHYLRPGDRVLDVGANVGLYTLLAARLVGPAGRVDAFEPSPPAARELSAHVRLNGLEQVVAVHEAALADRAGEALLSEGRGVTNHLIAGEGDGARVVCRTLDEVGADRDYALGKIDVEGAEPLVFEGGQRLLRTASPPVWILELNGLLRRYGWSEEGLARWLAERGYRLGVYDPEARAFSFPPRAWEEAPCENVFALAQAQEEKVLARLVEGRTTSA